MSHTFSDGQTMCPYNPSHVVSRLRAIPHLVKCRLQHPHLMEKVRICPYNQGHHIPSEEMATHLQTCEEYGASKSVSSSYIATSRGHINPHKYSSLPTGSGQQQPSKNVSGRVVNVIDSEELAEWT